MADESKGSIFAGFAHLGAAFASTAFPYLVGIGIMLAASHWDGHLHDQKGCFQLQELQGRAFKVDTCSGKTEELKIESNDPGSKPSTGPGVPKPVASPPSARDSSAKDIPQK